MLLFVRQGLSYGADGTIFETTGLYGQSKVRRINPQTFDVQLSVDLERQYFGEGSTFYRDAQGHDKLIQITWRKRTGFIYDAWTLDTLSQFQYTTGVFAGEAMRGSRPPGSCARRASTLSHFAFSSPAVPRPQKRRVGDHLRRLQPGVRRERRHEHPVLLGPRHAGGEAQGGDHPPRRAPAGPAK